MLAPSPTAPIAPLHGFVHLPYLVMRLSDFIESGLAHLIFLWEQNRGDTPIPFRDDPKFSGGKGVGA